MPQWNTLISSQGEMAGTDVSAPEHTRRVGWTVWYPRGGTQCLNHKQRPLRNLLKICYAEHKGHITSFGGSLLWSLSRVHCALLWMSKILPKLHVQAGFLPSRRQEPGRNVSKRQQSPWAATTAGPGCLSSGSDHIYPTKLFCAVLFSPGAECGHPSFILVWKRSGNEKIGNRRWDPTRTGKAIQRNHVSKKTKRKWRKKRGPKEKAIQRLQRELSWWQRFRVKSTTSCFWWGQPTYAGHFQHSSPIPKLCCWEPVPGAHKSLSRRELAWEILKAQRVSILISLYFNTHALGANLSIRPPKPTLLYSNNLSAKHTPNAGSPRRAQSTSLFPSPPSFPSSGRFWLFP